MFSGIVQDIGIVRSVVPQAGGLRLGIETAMDLHDTRTGASIACAGCCLTVVAIEKNIFYTDVSAETLDKTSIGEWQKGMRINLEPSLRLGDPLDGHFVYGHVDGLARVEEIVPDGDSRRLTLLLPDALAAFLAPKGSIALDGVSLTVNGVRGARFDVNIIPHTLAHTTLGLAKPGDVLNAEIDMLARYAARILGKEAA